MIVRSTNVGARTDLAFDTQGCMWSVIYLSALEGDVNEIELSAE
jgi:hypothetical protein